MSARAMVRFLAATSVAALLAMGLTTGAAGAAVHRAPSEADCEALSTVGDNVDSGSNVFGKQAQQLADSFGDAASDADSKKLKKALTTMSSFYDDLSGATNIIAAGKITLSKAKAYGKALKVFAKAEFACATSDITLPTNVTLPGGVTLPNVTLPR